MNLLIKKIFLIFFLYLTTCKLTYVATVLRHGARYPISNIYDGKQTAKYHGQLTTVGMRQQYLLGTYLKSDYIDNAKLINSTLYTKQIQIFADTSQRCVQSAICHLLGLFPFGIGSTIPDGISKELLDPPFQSFIKKNNLKKEQVMGQFSLLKGFQAVPYKNGSIYFDCPYWDYIFYKRGIEIATQLIKFQIEQAFFVEKMRLIFNLTTQQSNIEGLTKLFDVVICDMNLGRKLPSQFTKQDFLHLKFIQNYLLILTNEENPAKIFSTNIMSSILYNMDNIIKYGKDQVKKYSIYSGHDSNVVPLLIFLNLTSSQCIKKIYKNQTVKGNCAQSPPFAANLILQLHQNDESLDYFVKIRYNGYYLNACNDKQQCPYNIFSQQVRDQFVDVVKECGFKNDKQIIIVQQ